MASPPARVVTLSATATASPPEAVISATTDSATSLVGSSPAKDTPMSATTRRAPSAAAASGHGPSDAAAAAGDGDHLAVEERAHRHAFLLPVDLSVRQRVGMPARGCVEPAGRPLRRTWRAPAAG